MSEEVNNKEVMKDLGEEKFTKKPKRQNKKKVCNWKGQNSTKKTNRYMQYAPKRVNYCN